METFELRKVCNDLLADIKEETHNQNIVRLSIDIQLPEKFNGVHQSLTRPIKESSNYLSKLLINGVISIEITLRNIHGSLVLAHVQVIGFGSSRNKEFEKFRTNTEKEITCIINEDQISIEFNHTLDAFDQMRTGTRPPFDKRRILVAEDNEINAMVFSSFLEEWGVAAFMAVNGADAISQIHDSSFDAILMDIHMPVLNGNLATQKIREFNADIPIIALTASTREEDIREAIASGANDYLLKPVSSNHLFQVLSKYL